MARLGRYLQKIFGDIASANQIAEFGSAAASGFVGGNTYDGTSITPDIVQALSNYDEGYFAAVDGEYNPAIEDENALNWLWSRQIKYLTQTGVAEWISTETYYTGNFASDGAGSLYYSLVDTNLNNALTDTTKWRKVIGPNTVVTSSADYQIKAGDRLIRVSGAHTWTLPDATLNTGSIYTIKKTDSGTTSAIALLLAQTADGQASLSLTEQYGFFTLQSNGTNYDIVAWG